MSDLKSPTPLYILAILALTAVPAHAQKSAIVQCQVGVSVSRVPDYVCDAMLEAFPVISFQVNNQARWMNSLKECAAVVSRRLTATYPGAVDTLCLHMWQDNTAHVYDDAKGVRHFR